MPRKRSNPTRNVPHEASRSRTDWAGATHREVSRNKRGKARIQGERGSMPVSPEPPKPPPVLAFYELIVTPEEAQPTAVYGQYPRRFITRVLCLLSCQRHEILHVCSGSLPPGEGIRVDMRREACPDILADGRALPLADSSVKAVLIDPPYTEHYARQFYGVDYPRPSHLLAEAARVVVPGGRIGFLHYITPKPPPGTRFVTARGVSTGFDMPVRAFTVFEKHQPTLPGLGHEE